jgi:hypothetical protein
MEPGTKESSGITRLMGLEDFSTTMEIFTKENSEMTRLTAKEHIDTVLVLDTPDAGEMTKKMGLAERIGMMVLTMKGTLKQG